MKYNRCILGNRLCYVGTKKDCGDELFSDSDEAVDEYLSRLVVNGQKVNRGDKLTLHLWRPFGVPVALIESFANSFICEIEYYIYETGMCAEGEDSIPNGLKSEFKDKIQEALKSLFENYTYKYEPTGATIEIDLYGAAEEDMRAE